MKTNTTTSIKSVLVKGTCNTPFCVICRTHNHRAGYGINIGNGPHICMECAEYIHDFLEQIYACQEKAMLQTILGTPRPKECDAEFPNERKIPS